jgi:hypothetical protein
MRIESAKTRAPEIGEVLTDPNEIAFLRQWRAADGRERRDIEKVLRAALADLLPTAEQVHAMTLSERRALIDSLPDWN